jgi:hypothetical protein
MGEELGILIDGDHAGATRLDRRPEAHRLSREQGFAGVRFENPRDDLDQRRLAGAVLADERLDAPGAMSNETSDSAFDSPKALSMPIMRRTGVRELSATPASHRLRRSAVASLSRTDARGRLGDGSLFARPHVSPSHHRLTLLRAPRGIRFVLERKREEQPQQSITDRSCCQRGFVPSA